MPSSSVSYIWQVTGCQHTLQPTTDDFAPPTIPALTPRGFCRWESVEILLGPEEHVPFIQYAVKNWDLRHPETGECFPADLPADVFPTQPDAKVDLWHRSCGERLSREAATDKRSSSRSDRETDNGEAKHPYVYPPYTSAGSTPQQQRKKSEEQDYFGRFANVNMPNRQGSKRERPNKSPEKSDKPRSFPAGEKGRRRSLSDFSSPPPSANAPPYMDEDGFLDPSGRQPPQARRHSHPRPLSSSSDEDEPANYRTYRRPHAGGGSPPPPPSIRRVPPPGPPRPSHSTSSRPQRPDGRPDDQLRRNGLSPLGSLRKKFTDTVSSVLPNGLTSDRSRPSSRHYSSNEHLRQRRSREQFAPSRLSRSYSDLDSDGDSDVGPTDEGRRRRRRGPPPPEERDRDRERDRTERDRYRERDRAPEGDRERDDERDLGRRDRQYMRRPEAQRRTSSHADIDRRREPVPWDSHDKERFRDERDRRRWDTRRSPGEEDLSSPPIGMPGRRHAEPAYT